MDLNITVLMTVDQKKFLETVKDLTELVNHSKSLTRLFDILPWRRITMTFKMASKSSMTQDAARGGQNILYDSTNSSSETLKDASLRPSTASSETEIASIDDSSYVELNSSLADDLQNLHVTTSPQEQDSTLRNQRLIASHRDSEGPSIHESAQRLLTGSLFENAAPETSQDQQPLLEKNLQALDPIRAYHLSAVNAAATHLETRSASGSQAIRRILAEVKAIRRWQEPLLLGFAPVEDDLYNLVGAIIGPSGSPYEGGVFYLRVRYPEDYPFRPPQFCFLTKMYHPNINNHGRICLDILATQWSPTLTLPVLLISILSILSDPDCDSPVVREIAKLYRTDRRTYEQTARLYTQEYGTGVEPPKALIEHPPGLA